MIFTPINKQKNPMAKLLWKIVLDEMYENPKFIENKDSTYLVVSNEFESLVWQNGDYIVDSSFYIENLINNTVSKNNFADNLEFTLSYFKKTEELHEKISEFEMDVRSEFGKIEDYDIRYDKATELFFNYLIQGTKSGKIPKEVEKWLMEQCITFTTEFSEPDGLSLEEIQDTINIYAR